MMSNCLADFAEVVPCQACQVRIVFAVTRSDKRIPMDVYPSSVGNVAVRHEGGHLVAHVFGKVDAFEAREAGAKLYLSHFATCPDSKRFRKGAKP